jgi:hypothetical protein
MCLILLYRGLWAGTRETRLKKLVTEPDLEIEVMEEIDANAR